MPLRWVLQFYRSEPEIHILVVMTVLDVFEEAPNHRRRNHVSDTLRDVAAISLERHADHLRVLHHGSAAVARIDLRADLNREMLINRRMGIELEIDSRNDAGGHRHSLAAQRITIGRYDRFQLRNPAKR